MQPGQLRLVEEAREPVPHRDQHQGPLGRQAARHERQHRTAGLIEPVRIVGDRQHGRAFGRVADQFQRGQADQEQLGRGVLRHAKRRQQRRTLPGRQSVGPAKDGPQQLVQAREREPRLGLNPYGGQHQEPVIRCLRPDRGQQGGLPIPGSPRMISAPPLSSASWPTRPVTTPSSRSRPCSRYPPASPARGARSGAPRHGMSFGPHHASPLEKGLPGSAW